MVVEPVTGVAALVAAVKGIGELVSASAGLVGEIRSGFRARNEGAKEQLARALQETSQTLQQAGQLASIAEEYAQTLEEVLQLLWRCREVEQFLKGNWEELRTGEATNTGRWQVLDMMLDAIGRNMETARRVTLNRKQWYDERDWDQLDPAISRFTVAYGKAASSLKARDAGLMEPELSSMTGHLQEAETALRDTLYKRVLPALKGVGG